MVDITLKKWWAPGGARTHHVNQLS